MSTADTWRESGGRADRRAAARPEAADYVSRIGRPPVPPPPPRMRSAELPPFPEDMARSARRADNRPASALPRVPGERGARPSANAGRGRSVRPEAARPRVSEERAAEPRDLDEEGRRRGTRPPESRSASPRPAGRGATAQAPESRSRLRGAVAVLAVLLVTLAGAALESWISTGLGLVTLVVLTVASAAATSVVRRRDLLTTVVAPPLVYILVAVLNTALAPSASLNLASVATLLIRGFPAMAIATAAAAVVALIRWAARR
ncbi:MAG TPA: DUF6542 domain-containing protein [Geodermatophilus sp.]|nr:DUF6542 domain-containing protein [Geodermatophilus sp.]